MSIEGKFTTNDVVSFQVYPSSIFGDVYHDLTLTDIASYSTTKFFGFDALAEHAKALPYLPAGIDQDPTRYRYLVFKPSQGKHIVVPEPWIKTDTIKVIKMIDTKVYIPNWGPEKHEELRRALSSIGASGFQITSASGSNVNK